MLELDVVSPGGGASGWTEAAMRLREHLDGAEGRRVVLRVAGLATGTTPRLDEPVQPLLDACEALSRVLRRTGPRFVNARGLVTGPFVAVVLSADLLSVEPGMACRLLEWQDRPLPLPGDLSAVLDRLGRARALEAALTGSIASGDELVARGGALASGDAAWESALRSSRLAQRLASCVLRRREAGRSASDALERATFALCFSAPDRLEGVAAFLTGRQPTFTDNDNDDGDRPGTARE